MTILAEPRLSSLLSAGLFEDATPLDLSGIDMGWSNVEGFSRPDWNRIGEQVRASFPEEQWPQIWRQLGINWLTRLRDDLGGDYRQYESWNFLLLSAESKAQSEALLRIAESATDSIEASLGALLQQQEAYGKNVILAFHDQDDYYRYVSFYYPEGHHSLSGGVFLHRNYDYGHIAFPFVSSVIAEHVIPHELTHNSLWTLRIPTWLNEGLSVRLEKEISWRRSPRKTSPQNSILDREMAARQQAWWNEETIQEFWAGISVYRPDGTSELSYKLAEILVALLAEYRGDFLNFIRNADFHDGGEDAALKCLGKSLGDVLAGFLGPGNWRPNRQRIAELWAQREKQDAAGESA